MIDGPLVIRKMVLISDDLKEILALSRRPLQEYLGDFHAEVLAERYLERVIGRMIDINYHLITAVGHHPPKDYYESFIKLGALGVLPSELARALAASTGLRNRIAHEYDELDHAKVHDGLRSAARDVPLYLQCVQSRLDAIGDPPPA
jgi:uncharacterized protein YutE (UPF0331/DUF86 family)